MNIDHISPLTTACVYHSYSLGYSSEVLAGILLKILKPEVIVIFMSKINILPKTQEKVVTTAYYHLYVIYINTYV